MPYFVVLICNSLNVFLSVVSDSKVETNDDQDNDEEEEFLKTYKTILGKWEQVCDLNSKLT